VLGDLLPLFGVWLLLVRLFDRFAVRRSARRGRVFDPA
jgi:hypothetical protein